MRRTWNCYSLQHSIPVHVVCKKEMSAVAGLVLYWACVCYPRSSVHLLTSGISLRQVLQWSICRARKWGESVSWFATRTIRFPSRLCWRSHCLQGEIKLIFIAEWAQMVICDVDIECQEAWGSVECHNELGLATLSWTLESIFSVKWLCSSQNVWNTCDKNIKKL